MADKDLTACLNTILQNKVLVKRTEANQITLREPDRNSKMQVVVQGMPDRVTVINISKIGHMGTLKVSGDSHWNKRCDYLLLTDHGDECHATLIELKSTLNEKHRAYTQLQRSRPIVDYLISVCAVEQQTSWRYCVSYTLIAEKQTGRIDKQPTHQEPRQPMKEQVDGVDYTVFVGTDFRADQLAKLPGSSTS